MALRSFRFAKNRLRKGALKSPCKTVSRPCWFGAMIWAIARFKAETVSQRRPA